MPSVTGPLGERGAFWAGFVGLGALILAGMGLLPLLGSSRESAIARAKGGEA